jgi:uncharacterized protein (UPF0333 family)
MNTLEELRTEATELGIEFSKTSGVAQLTKKIDEFYEKTETSGKVVEEAVKDFEAKEGKKEKEEKETLKTKNISKTDKRIAREAAAKKTRIVIVIDNDQRVNNQTTTCTVSCANEFFDLGTKIIPLNEKVEVRVGHISTLEELLISQHVRDSKTGLSMVKMRARYSVSYQDK